MNTKNLIILSEKSSGSSVLQGLLADCSEIRNVEKTRHFENETLYWTAAASFLNLPQIKMVDSEVPMRRSQARRELEALIVDNLQCEIPEFDDPREFVFWGWRELCHHYAPVFLEKSPHHLCQWSALELILEFSDRTDDVDVRFIGLVRSPMDTIYSQYDRWRSPPGRVERQWVIAYDNLKRLKAMLGERLSVVRYEDLVTSSQTIRQIIEDLGLDYSGDAKEILHKSSLRKWDRDSRFGFSLSEETIELAQEYGYTREELLNEGSSILWYMTYFLQRVLRLAKICIKRWIGRE